MSNATPMSISAAPNELELDAAARRAQPATDARAPFSQPLAPRGAASKPRVMPGVVATLWHADGLDEAWNPAVEELLSIARPQVVQLHSAPRGHQRYVRAVANAVRRSLPGVRLWLGVACDGWLWEWARGSCTRGSAQRHLTECARLAHELGAEAICWDGEAAYREHPSRGRELARAVLEETSAEHPALAQVFTSYDHPHYHPDPWRSWCYPGSPVTAALPQVYAAPGGIDVIAHRGAFPRREKTAFASWQAVVCSAWVGGDVASDAGVVDRALDWYPYLQGHSVPAIDAIPFALRHALTSWWALPSRLDREGRTALIAACVLRRLGYVGAHAVARFQSNARLAVDGVCGPKTLAALGL